MGKKHHACRACQHEKKTEIDRALLSGEAARQVASRYGLSATGLQRHQKHIAPSLVKAREAVEVGQASNVLSFVRGLVDKAHQFTNLAEQKGDLRTAMTGLRELTRMAELLAMLIYLVRRGFANGRIDGRKRRLVPEYWLSPELTQAILYLILCRYMRQALLPNCNKGCRDQICEQK
jgi:hypothetical protein